MPLSREQDSDRGDVAVPADPEVQVDSAHRRGQGCPEFRAAISPTVDVLPRGVMAPRGARLVATTGFTGAGGRGRGGGGGGAADGDVGVHAHRLVSVDGAVNVEGWQSDPAGGCVQVRRWLL